MASLGRDTLGNLTQASRLEWLVTNGIGGYASSTVTGLNTRRYHGILVASRRPPVERIVLVSRLEETLLIGGREFPLSTSHTRRDLHPVGHIHLERFERDPFPTWVYQIQDVLVTKTLCMIYGQNSTLVTYKVMSGRDDLELRIRPHFLFRDFHGNMYENPGFSDDATYTAQGFTFQPFANAPALSLAWDRGTFVRAPAWYREIYLAEEANRGLNPCEDDFSTGFLSLAPATGSVSLLCSDQPVGSFNPVDLRRREEIRLEAVASAMKSDDPFLRRLLLAADQFIVARRSTGGKTILAGYPWFSDWGRDTLISLPGLTMVTGRFEDARSILRTFAQSIRDGLVPNCFADQGTEALYNSVDASLWLFHAVYKFIEYTDDYAFVRENLFRPMMAVIEAFQNGTRFGIQMDPDDGLVLAGEKGVQLTWMDAKVDDWVVTPRHGKAVEINALWYNALKVTELLLEKFDQDAREVGALARKVKTSFRRRFWSEEEGCLFDCLAADGTPDRAFRPNQIFAVYLPFPLLDPPQEKQVVAEVFERLYTSYGLRSLAANEPLYMGKYDGNRQKRDGAYHQGTVWAFLIGPFISSFLKVHQSSMEAQLRASHMLEPFKIHLDQEGCLGNISEIFDGNPPHTCAGCFAQAWSVAELLRCYVEDIKGQRPMLMV
ncbi:MAG: glycogen debranching protein [Candidatus Riflebacteria bacterium]|nr:glycogen debranching protein [Candidatus Riflebacteria bacterium]